MTAWLQFHRAGLAIRADDCDAIGKRILYAGRWRKVITIRGRHYVNVMGQPINVTLE